MEQVAEKRIVEIILDTEFNMKVDGKIVDTISIALVDASGKHVYHGVSNEFNQQAAANHPFLPEHVLPKLPPEHERISNAEIGNGVRAYLEKVVRDVGANRAYLWAKNGAMGDYTVLNLLLNDELYPYMRSLGVERTYLKDTYDLFNQAGRPDLSSLPPLEEKDRHTALGDVLREREVFLLCRRIIEARTPTHL